MRPRYELRIGAHSASDEATAGGPLVLAVDRDVDVPLDVARIRLADRSGVAVGDDCTLALGLDDTPERVFGGTVAEVLVGPTGATVVVAGTMGALLDLRDTVTWTQATLGTIARDLAGRAGLTAADVAEGPMLPWFVLDARRGAHAQLAALAARFGMDLYADRSGGLVLRGLPGGGPGGALAGAAGAATGDLRHGADVIAAGSRHAAAPWDAVGVGGESPSSSRGASSATWLTTDDDVSRGDSGSGARRLLLLDPLARTKDLARDIADGTLRFAGRAAHVVEVTVPGRPGMDLGDPVGIAGGSADDLLRGRGHVRRLRHRLDPWDGFTTRIGVALPAPAAEVG